MNNTQSNPNSSSSSASCQRRCISSIHRNSAKVHRVNDGVFAQNTHLFGPLDFLYMVNLVLTLNSRLKQALKRLLYALLVSFLRNYIEVIYNLNL